METNFYPIERVFFEHLKFFFKIQGAKTTHNTSNLYFLAQEKTLGKFGTSAKKFY